MYLQSDMTQPIVINEDITFLRQLLADLLEQQSNPRLNDSKQAQCKKGIRALRSAIDALEIQVYA
jgi:hypothetical protein